MKALTGLFPCPRSHALFERLNRTCNGTSGFSSLRRDAFFADHSPVHALRRGSRWYPISSTRDRFLSWRGQWVLYVYMVWISTELAYRNFLRCTYSSVSPNYNGVNTRFTARPGRNIPLSTLSFTVNLGGVSASVATPRINTTPSITSTTFKRPCSNLAQLETVECWCCNILRALL